MSRYEHVDAEFWEVASRARLEHPNRFQDACQLPLDGQVILTHAGIGEDFREAVYKSIGQTLAEPSNAGKSLSGKKAVRDMERALSKRLQRGDFEIGPEDLVAISGFGVIIATTEPESDNDDDEDFGDVFVRAINDTCNAFGRVKSIRHSDFPYFSGEVEEFEGIDDLEYEEVPTIGSEGLTLVLKDLVICDAGGYGEIREGFDEGFVPLPEGRLLIQKGFPLSELVSRPYV